MGNLCVFVRQLGDDFDYDEISQIFTKLIRSTRSKSLEFLDWRTAFEGDHMFASAAAASSGRGLRDLDIGWALPPTETLESVIAKTPVFCKPSVAAIEEANRARQH
nr:hypothetical protein Iba_chr03aCG5770 [Ipomoea batatas]